MYLFILYSILAAQVIGLIVAVVMDKALDKSQKRLMFINSLLVITLILQNVLDSRFSKMENMVYPRIATGVLGYTIRPVILVVWIYLLRKNQKMLIPWVMIVINTLVHLTAFFTGFCFTIRPDNTFSRGPLGYTCHVISGLLLLYVFWLSADKYVDTTNESDGEKKTSYTSLADYKYGLEGLIPTMCVFLIIASVIMDTTEAYTRIGPVSFLTAAVVTSNLLYYIWLHRQISRKRI